MPQPQRRRIMRSFRLKEISAVTYPAQEHARMVIMKRRDDGSRRGIFAPALSDIGKVGSVLFFDKASQVGAIMKYVEAMDFNEVVEESEAQAIADDLCAQIYEAWSALGHSFYTISSDENLSADDKIEEMQNSLRQFIAALRELAPDVEKALVERLKSEPATAVLVAGLEAGSHEEGSHPMPKTLQEQITELQGSMAALNTELATAREALTASQATATDLSTRLEAETAKVKALEQAAEVAKSEETFTAEDGTVIKKSECGSEAVFKQLKAQAEKIELGEFANKARTELPALKGTDAEKAVVLRAISRIPDEAVRKRAHEMLAAGNKAMAELMKSRGHGGNGIDDADSPDAKLQALVEAQKAANPKLTEAQATDAVLKTAEGAKLYQETREARRAAQR